MNLKSLKNTAKLMLVLGLLLISFLAFASHAIAQTSNDEWAVPVNLSQSGSATDPRWVADASGTIHVFWRDTAVGSFVYIRGRPGDWSEPVPIEPPFGTRQYFPNLAPSDPTPLFSPVLIASADGRIHAFWIDDQSSLRHSWVQSDAVTDFSAWSARIRLAQRASDFSVTSDENNQIYLSYIGTPADETLSPGVNFMRFDSAEGDWTTPISLYESDYFQNLTPARSNVNMVAVADDGGPSQVYLAWDNRSLEKLFFIRSGDGGLSWEDPLIVDQRKASDEPDTIGPNNIIVAADATDVLLLWQSGHGADVCSQYYQYSSDGGLTWSVPANISEEFSSCPEQSQIVGKVADDVTILSTTYQGQSYLLAWDGSRWSNPQRQETLEGFDSVEIYRPITLECHQLDMFDGNQLMAIACGQGLNDQITDIWQTSRALGEIESWFSSSPQWSTPVIVSGNANMASSPNMVADNQGNVHAFWSQPSETTAARSSIFYSRWDGERWISPLPIITSPSGSATQPEVVLDDDDRLMAIWLNGLGEINFSQVSVEQVAFVEGWSNPITLPSLDKRVSEADIAIDKVGTINVAFSIPVNESRGIYLTRSDDLGESWQEPILVFDGLSAEWDIVGKPRLASSDDSVLHLLWAKQILLEDEVTTQALFYAHSIDGGQTFTEPQIVAEVPITWFELVSSESGAVHRFWQEQLSSNTIIRHDYSLDDGQTWSEPLQVSSKPGPVSIAADSSGQLHAVLGEAEQITYYTWDGDSWRSEESARLLFSNGAETIPPQSIIAVISSDQKLVILYDSNLTGSENAQTEIGYFARWRNIDTPETLSIPAPTSLPLAAESTSAPAATIKTTPIPSETSAPQLLSTPTVIVANNLGDSQGISGFLNSDNEIVRLVIAFLPVGLFLAIVFGVGFWIRRTPRN